MNIYGLTPVSCGRLERRELWVTAAEPLQADFPFARSFVAVRSSVTRKGKGLATEIRYFLSSMSRAEQSPHRWLELIRGHWTGVENRNHWRRDACGLEDKTRSRKPNIVGALALLRNATLALAHPLLETYGSLPALMEACAARTSLALNLLRGR